MDRPARSRTAQVTCAPGVVALAFGQAAYVPSGSGALVDVIGSSLAHVVGVVSAAEFAALAILQAGAPVILPYWGPDYALSGLVIMGTSAVNIPNGWGRALNSTLETAQFLVLPGNVFVISSSAAAVAPIHSFRVDEFTNPDEFARFATA